MALPLTILNVGRMILMPTQKRFEQLCESIATRLENADVTEAALQATLPEVREQLVRRRYAELFAGEGRQSSGKPKAPKLKGGERKRSE